MAPDETLAPADQVAIDRAWDLIHCAALALADRFPPATAALIATDLVARAVAPSVALTAWSQATTGRPN